MYYKYINLEQIVPICCKFFQFGAGSVHAKICQACTGFCCIGINILSQQELGFQHLYTVSTLHMK